LNEAMDGGIGLWLAVIASGLYHGLSPGMGWPLAVSAGLWEKRGSAVFRAFVPLAFGHFAAMMIVLLPFAFLAWFVERSTAIRVGAGVLVVAFGLWRLIDRRHPRALARIKPTQLALWSFVMAIAHGAGLLLVPIYLGMAMGGEPAGHTGHMSHIGMQTEAGAALTIAALHTLAMFAGGAAMAWAVYRYVGLQFLKKSWFNLEALWSLSLILAGAAGVWTAVS
jgi:hypothetical protein